MEFWLASPAASAMGVGAVIHAQRRPGERNLLKVCGGHLALQRFQMVHMSTFKLGSYSFSFHIYLIGFANAADP